MSNSRETQNQRLREFTRLGTTRPISYVETMQVKQGVECDVYTFDGEDSEDLAIVRVAPGAATPRQRVLAGERTTEGYYLGEGVLTIESPDGSFQKFEFIEAVQSSSAEIEVQIGQIMQWEAGPAGLQFYEICSPPYQDGRYEDLPDKERTS